MGNLISRIQEAMDAKGMRQADVCRATGMTTAQMSNIMTGKIDNPTLSTLVKLATALDVDMNYICGWSYED